MAIHNGLSRRKIYFFFILLFFIFFYLLRFFFFCSLQNRGGVFVLTLTGNSEHHLGHNFITAVHSALTYTRFEFSSFDAGVGAGAGTGTGGVRGGGKGGSVALITGHQGRGGGRGGNESWREKKMDERKKGIRIFSSVS